MFLQFFNPNNSGASASGYQLFTYIAGTSTKQATWTDSTQSVQNANPLPLDSGGVGYIWGDPTVNYKFVWALPNDTDPPTSPIRTVDNISFPTTVAVVQTVIAGSGLATWPFNESSFTPTLSGSGVTGNTLLTARYSQIGGVATFQIRWDWTGGSAPGGEVTVTGLPLAAKYDVNLPVITSGVTRSSEIQGFIQHGTAIMKLYNMGDTITLLDGTQFTNNSGLLIVSGSYQV